MGVQLKRVYDKPVKADGRRLLVDRIWPRGLKKRSARIDKWFKDVAPTTGLRKWFGHDPSRWEEFKRRYFRELDNHRERVQQLARESKKRTITLLFGAKDTEHNNAVALKEYLHKLV